MTRPSQGRVLGDGSRLPAAGGLWGVHGLRMGCLLALLWALPAPVRAAVGLDLRIPEAETYVLGDAIPLYWRFSNGSTQALGFMWEGCCRLNGRLEVRTASGEVPVAPPGQALAHMFAKADRLEPGVPKDYDTRVGDWVRLPGTGTYRLKGTYRGVLPSQYPQVQRGLALWRDAADSPELELRVLAVADYLSQREERVRRRGLRLTLEGPARVSPLAPTRCRVTFENTSGSAQSVSWPDGVALWVVDGRGERVAPAAVVGGPVETLDVPAGGRVERAFVVESDRFEGETFGEHTWFVDLAAGGDGSRQPRVPSNEKRVVWRWTAEEVRGLVVAASRGAGTGARNAPLKMMRVHLGEAGAELARLAAAEKDPGVAAVAGRLAFAARIKPLQPVPGAVALRVGVEVDGRLGWADPFLARPELWPAAGMDVRAQVGAVLGVRRDLGWEVSLVLEPGPGVEVGRVFAAGGGWPAAEMGLAAPVAVQVPVGATNAPARLVLDVAGGGARGMAMVRVGSGGRQGRVEGGPWVDLREDTVLLDWAGKVAAAGGSLRVELDPGMRWEDGLRAVRPLLRSGGALPLGPAEGGG